MLSRPSSSSRGLGRRCNLDLFPRDGAGLERLLDQGSLIDIDHPRRATQAVWDALSWIFDRRESIDDPSTAGSHFSIPRSRWLESNARREF
jgi:hypothetical protein